MDKQAATEVKVIDITGYTVVRALDEGGAARVYLAVQENVAREVVLKVVSAPPKEEPTFTARFLQEARVISRLRHPNIVSVYDAGVQGNQHYLCMEYVHGIDLAQKRRSLTPPQTLQIIREVAKALDYASTQGCVHRDIKPGNIILHRDNGRAVLSNFGIPCLAQNRSGTAPRYMSPEQAKNSPPDCRSDIYSLGVVLLELLTGRVRYDHDSQGVNYLQETTPRLPGNLRVLQPIIDKVLANDPAERYQSGAELIAAIDAITDDDIEAIQIASKHYAARVRQRRASAKAAGDTEETPVAGVVLDTRKAASVGGSSARPTSAQRKTAVKGSSARKKATHLQATGRNSATASPSFPPGKPFHSDWVIREHNPESELAVAEEDRRDYRDSAEGRRRWPLALAFVCVFTVIGGTYFRHDLPPQMAAAANALAEESLAIRNRLSATILAGSLAMWTAVNQLNESAEPPLDSGIQEGTNPSPPGQGNSPEPSGGAFNSGEGGSTSARNLLHERVRSLREQLDQDLSVSPELADSYRQLLAATSADEIPRRGLQQLLERHYRSLREALGQRDLERAQSYFASLEATFPADDGVVELKNNEEYQHLQQSFEQARKAQSYVARGERYLAAGALSTPAGANAREAYQRALELDAGNPNALAGMEKLVDRYLEITKQSMDKGNMTRAVEMASRGLNIDGGHETLAELRASAQIRLKQQRSFPQLRSLAEQQMAAENYTSPRGESAFDYYQEILALDPNDNQAARGLARIERILVHTTETHINRNQFAKARQLLRTAQELFGERERFTSLGLALERAAEAEFMSRQARISQVSVSSRRPESVGQVQSNTLKAERTIHIGFTYQNFKSNTSVVQAMLYNASRELPIAQVPIIVDGKNGVRFFQIDRPVEGFAEGDYKIDLMLNNESLSTQSFRVERG